MTGNSKPARLLWVLFFSIAAVAGASPLSGADREKSKEGGHRSPSPEFRQAKRDFQQKFRSRQPTVRAEAVRKLAEAPHAEAAELIWQAVLDDQASIVREAAIELIGSWREESEVSHHLLELLSRATRKSGMDQRTYLLLRALGPCEDTDLQGLIIGYLDEFLGTPKANQSLLHTLVDDLAREHNESAFRTLTLFTRSKFFGTNFGFRRCLLQGIVCVPGDETIGWLIEILPKLTGLVQFDVISYLQKATGQEYRDDVAAWKAWWLSRSEDEKREPKQVPPIGVAGRRGFYGIPIGAKRVVFVLDISGSMSGDKLEAAKRELIAAIESLTPDVFFGVVTFNRQVFVWNRTLVAANAENRRRAINSVTVQEAARDTASYDALEAALGLDPEAIYFVSDGAPSAGKIVPPADIVASIAGINHVRRVSIHTIGIGTNDTTAAFFGRFMRQLAEADWGEYREVGE